MISLNFNRKTILILSIFIILSIIVVPSECQSLERLTAQNPCMSKATCRDCIQTQGCAWCLQPDFGDTPRCFQPSLPHRNKECLEQYTWNPDNEQSILVGKQLTRSSLSGGGGGYESGYHVSGNSSWSSSGGGSGSGAAGGSEGGWGAAGGGASASGQIVQIYPQRVSLKCRMGQPNRLEMKYSQTEDYPVDLYYLMDLSKSMEDDKEKLSGLGDLLTSTMRKITSNFRLGFGSFVDKVLMPYVSTVPKKLEQPCDNCAAPYGYKNQMKLSTNTKHFSEQVNAAHVSGNLDAPEGGFDAIMQAVVCRDQIGWRDQARRLLVFSTDAGFHYAGDGKLGGVITPNDGLCHLDERGTYTHSDVLDYPSISQINLKVKENAINVIFAVTQQQIGVYNKLSANIEGSSSAVLSDDSSNVVELVRDEYNKISSSVEMKDTSSSAISVSYYSSCLGDGPLTKTRKCDGLKVGTTVEFIAEIMIESCPPDPKDWLQTFQIYPVGINESLTVDLEMLCSCPCERTGYEVKSPKCHGHGTYKCGICECDENNFGRTCECSITDLHSESERNLGCRPDNTTMTDCSGRGTCVCGVCECDKRTDPNDIIDGKYCDCDNFSCDRHNELVCSGVKNGICQCGTCICLGGWTGSACECRSSNTTCMNKNGEICSGHGECVCGECKCAATEEGRYSGTFCEKCPTCAGRCSELKDCVQCQMYQTGPLKDQDECALNCTFITTIGVETVTVDEEADEHMCTFYDEDDCKFQFVYSDKDPEIVKTRAQEQRDCPPKVFIIGIVLAVIAAIVLIGLAVLLLWKLLTTIHDRREFARFEKERMMAKWDTGENPIYKQATSTFKNPTYAGK